MRDQFGLVSFLNLLNTEFFSHDVHFTWGIYPETNGVRTDSHNGDCYFVTDQDSFA